jgi:GNAT superfamily N-acetyltransferase
MTVLEVHKIQPAQVPQALELILEVFREHIAPLYPPEGIAEFERYASVGAQLERLAHGHSLIGIESSLEGLLGVAELRGFRHLSMFFVKSSHQRQGFGRQLLTAVIDECEARDSAFSELSVHASPNSVAAYRRLGFVAQGPEQETRGVRFVPMIIRVGPIGGA